MLFATRGMLLFPGPTATTQHRCGLCQFQLINYFQASDNTKAPRKLVVHRQIIVPELYRKSKQVRHDKMGNFAHYF